MLQSNISEVAVLQSNISEVAVLESNISDVTVIQSDICEVGVLHTVSPGKGFGSKGKQRLKRTASETQSHNQ